MVIKTAPAYTSAESIDLGMKKPPCREAWWLYSITSIDFISGSSISTRPLEVSNVMLAISGVLSIACVQIQQKPEIVISSLEVTRKVLPL
jgi:hypothetical protein